MTFTDESFAELAGGVSGVVFRRGDAGVADETAAQNVLVKHDPDVVVGAADEQDVAAAVRFARSNDLAVHVLATGHGAYVPVTDGVLITTSRLSALAIDPERRVAHIGAGNHWSSVVAAAAEHALAPITGASGHVGVVGYLLGGGLGPLARTYGFSSDYVRSFEVVTADGEVLRASADENADLFWALRGGKGGFGVVTSVHLALVDLESFYGGSLFYDAESIPAVLGAWADFTATAPERATSSVAVIRFPPFDVVPEPLRGKTAITARIAYIGDPAEGERLFAPVQDAAPAIFGHVGVMPASEVSMIHNDPTDPSPVFDRGMLLDTVDHDFVAAFLEVLGPEQQVPIVAAELRHIGGATARDVPEGSAVGGRSAGYTFIMIGAPDPSLFGTVLPQIADGVTAHLARWVSTENNVNFAGDLSVPGSYEASWPAATFDRLASVREAYDPTHLFPYPDAPTAS
ncbi:FAD-binding oxidoreductase [Herbiconiux daphne]|uniref:FAD-binding protein n=1 Tax=Herbiconiux daphne TaxID=2970914 RepID=A0ABT2H3Q6_9MICO|nr:FAD-binding protein [Herbiconiux daphne]MCS5734571.1 FAD-binding protein [Herbiconiux daphne]